MIQTDGIVKTLSGVAQSLLVVSEFGAPPPKVPLSVWLCHIQLLLAGANLFVG
jgi:hypothetical protein